MSDNHETFSVFKIFILLLIMTAIEVVYGEIGNRYFYEQKFWLWGGLLLCAFIKGYYIFFYFMHVKYEGMIVKGNVLFTVPLIIYFMIMLTPDTGTNPQFNYGVAQQFDPMTNEVEHIGHGSRNVVNHGVRHLYPYLREQDAKANAGSAEDTVPGSGH